MNQLGFALVLIWGFVIFASILSVLIIDSYDCNQFDNGWDKICLNTNENHKARTLQIMPIVGIVFSALFIILIPRNKSQNIRSVRVRNE